FQTERFLGPLPQPLQLDQATARRQGQARSDFLLLADHAARQNFRARGQTASGHLLAKAHQLVKVDFWRSDKSASATPPLDHTLLFESGQCVPRSHKTHAMNPGQFSLRIDRVSRFQLPGFDTLQDRALDSPIGGRSVVVVFWHNRSRSEAAVYNEVL